MNATIKMQQVRCPNCGKLIARVSPDSKGTTECICPKSSCHYKFYVVDAKVRQEAPGQVFEMIK